MVYHDVVFPPDISYGSSGGPGFKTTVISLDSCAETRFARWSTPRRRYDVAYGVKTFDQLSILIDFFITRQGALNSFKYKDFFDFTTATDHRDAVSTLDVIVGTGDGVVTQFQLLKKYTSTAGDQSRVITKPVGSTVVASLDGVSTTAFSVNESTGIVTFGSAPGVGVVIRAGFEFYVHARFGEDIDEELSLSYDDFSSGSIGSIPIIEVVEENTDTESFDYGGSGTVTSAVDFELQTANGRFQVLTTTAASVVCTLPPAGDLELGGPHFYLLNNGAQSIVMKDGTATVLTLAAGATCVLLIYSVSSVQGYAGVLL